LLKIKTFGHVMKYYDTLFRYDIVSDIYLYCLLYVWNLILTHIWDAFGSLFKTVYDSMAPMLSVHSVGLSVTTDFLCCSCNFTMLPPLIFYAIGLSDACNHAVFVQFVVAVIWTPLKYSFWFFIITWASWLRFKLSCIYMNWTPSIGSRNSTNVTLQTG
jgi:hypothetical protein